MTYPFDLIVIGSGPGGQRAAVQGAKTGKKVLIVEEFSSMGGGCVHVGTLPSKSLRESVYRYSLSSRGTLGQEAEHHKDPLKTRVLPDMERLLRRKDRVVKTEAEIVFNQLERNLVTMKQGRAKIVSPHEVVVTQGGASETFSAKFILIATGAKPMAPPHIQVDGIHVLDSDSVLKLKTMPKSMVVLGAGIIGCEYASMFSMAGTQVYLVDRRNEILSTVDREISTHLFERFQAGGMEVVLGCETESIEIVPAKETRKASVKVHLNNHRKLHAEVALVCLGRSGNSSDLGLEALGIDCDSRGLIKVDPHFRTQVPSIYAVGDVVGNPALASTSMEQGRIACCHAFQMEATNFQGGYVMPPFFPYGIYTIPEISTLGKTEEELIELKANFVAGRARYRELARGQIVGDHWGLLKLLVDRSTLKLLGVQIVGDNAAELIHIGQAVMSLDGDVNYFIQNVFNYPTLAEAYKTAAFHAINQIRGTTSSK